jgi:hypothetical protein
MPKYRYTGNRMKGVDTESVEDRANEGARAGSGAGDVAPAGLVARTPGRLKRPCGSESLRLPAGEPQCASHQQKRAALRSANCVLLGREGS